MSPDNLPTYIPIQRAAEQYAVDPQLLHRAVESGIIRAVKTPEGRILVADEDVSEDVNVMVETDPELNGNPIRVTKAAERYGIDQKSLSRWAYAGHVHIIEHGPKLLILDEADVKRAAEIFHRAKHKTGSYIKAGWVLKRALAQQPLG